MTRIVFRLENLCYTRELPKILWKNWKNENKILKIFPSFCRIKILGFLFEFNYWWYIDVWMIICFLLWVALKSCRLIWWTRIPKEKKQKISSASTFTLEITLTWIRVISVEFLQTKYFLIKNTFLRCLPEEWMQPMVCFSKYL